MSLDIIKSIYYEFISYFIPQKIKYKIEGKCNKCGKCCKEIRCKHLNNEKEFKIMQFFIPAYKNFYIKGKDNHGELILSCKQLNEKNECSIYKRRPRVCRNYPKKYLNFNAQMLEGCGYSIVKKDFKEYL